MQMPETTSGLAVLSWLARAKAVSHKSYADAASDWLASNGAPAMSQHLFKAAVGAGSSASSTLGSEGVAIGPFSDSMRTASAFYRIWSDSGFIKVPMFSRVAMATSVPTAATVAEGAAVPVSRVVLNNIQLTPTRAAGLMVVTDTLLLDLGASAQAGFARQLQSVVAAAVDTKFVDLLDDGVTPISSISPTKDLRAALAAVPSGGDVPRLYWIASEDVGKFGSTLSTAATGPAFAAASAVGGELANLPLLISSGVPSGTLYLVDASGVAADAGPVTVDVSNQTDILMDSAPSGMNSATPSGTATLVSMFQTDSTALRATAVFGAAKIRSNAVAVVTGITTTTWAA